MSRKTNTRKPTRTNLSVLAQVCNLIPAFLTQKLAREFGVDKKARTFSPWSHLVALLYAQLTHAMSLIDACQSGDIIPISLDKASFFTYGPGHG